MGYQVLARKWRPRRFEELAGQDVTARTLIHALTHQHLHHAYLFTGTRGVGKTTLGRLLAKCMSCEKGISPHPCEQCTHCQAINQGNFIDLIEVDAASRTKVEDTRELLDNVQYVPTQGRFKIYLIDEVHMLSGHSFNALLKTLEEPPSHVKFIFATTDPERLPPTVVSRCLQFHLKNIPAAIIAAHLTHILQTEKIHFEPAALTRIAYAATGSMRDGLSLLDQAIAYGQGEIIDADIKTLLGSIEHDELIVFLDAIAANDIQSLQHALQQLTQHHCDYFQATNTLLSLIHSLALLQLFPTIPLDFYTQQPEKLHQLAQRFTPEKIHSLYQIGLIGRRDLPLAPTPKNGFEMMIIRLFTADTLTTLKTSAPTQTSHNTPSAPIAQNKPSQPTTPQKSSTIKQATNEIQHVTPLVNSENTTINTTTEWEVLLTQLKLTGLSQLLAQHCVLHKMEEDTLSLLLSPKQQPLLTPGAQERLAHALSQHFGKKIKLTITLNDKHQLTPLEKKRETEEKEQKKIIDNLQQDENIQHILSTFHGHIELNSIEKIK